MPCLVCFNSKTSKLDGHLSTLADKLLLFYEKIQTTAVEQRRRHISAVV